MSFQDSTPEASYQRLSDLIKKRKEDTLNVYGDVFEFRTSSLMTVPPEISSLKSLTTLNLGDNRIKSLPMDLGNMPMLVKLFLRGNMIEDIPDGLFSKMKNLSVLDLGENNIESLPEDIGSLSNLSSLWLDKNHLKVIPSTITELKKLKNFYIFQNSLTELPENIHALGSLEILDAHENEIRSELVNIHLLVNLKDLTFSGNKITAVPDKLWELKNLNFIRLLDNPIKNVPKKLLYKRAKVIKDYMELISLGKLKEANDLLEHSTNIPIRQKSIGAREHVAFPSVARMSRKFSTTTISSNVNTPEKKEKKETETEKKGEKVLKPTISQMALEIPSGIVRSASRALEKKTSQIDARPNIINRTDSIKKPSNEFNKRFRNLSESPKITNNTEKPLTNKPLTPKRHDQEKQNLNPNIPEEDTEILVKTIETKKTNTADVLPDSQVEEKTISENISEKVTIPEVENIETVGIVTIDSNTKNLDSNTEDVVEHQETTQNIETLEVQEKIINIDSPLHKTQEVIEIIVNDEKIVKKPKKTKKKAHVVEASPQPPMKKVLIKIYSKSYLLEKIEGSQNHDVFSAENMALKFPFLSTEYQTNFYNNPHINFIAEDEENGGFLVVSLLPVANNDTEVNCIVRGKDGDIGLLIPIPVVHPKNPPQWKRLLRNEPDFNNAVDEDIRLLFVTDPNFQEDCLELEQKLCRRDFKVGVVYCAEDQSTQEEMLSNDVGSPRFNDFLELLGRKIRLKDWDKYDGGLDVFDDQTGTHSIYTSYNNCNIMFHVSTLLPPCHGDEEKINEKKVHIGNDIVVVVFVDGESTFNPKKFVSKFNHVFIVVKYDNTSGKTHYRINVIHKNGVEPSIPPIPADTVYEKSPELRQLLLSKIINSELSACKSSEQLSQSFGTLRYHLIHNLFLKHKPKPKQGCFGACIAKKKK